MYRCEKCPRREKLRFQIPDRRFDRDEMKKKSDAHKSEDESHESEKGMWLGKLTKAIKTVPAYDYSVDFDEIELD